MRFLKSIFWNSEQSRPRTGFRLIVQLIIYIGIGAGLEEVLTTVGSHKDLSSDAPMWFFLCFAGILLVAGFLSTWLAGRFRSRR